MVKSTIYYSVHCLTRNIIQFVFCSETKISLGSIKASTSTGLKTGM